MSTQKARLSVLLGLALSSCLDFATGLEMCRDGGRCAAEMVGAGGGTGSGTGGGAFDSTPSSTASTVTASPTLLPADGKSAATVTVTVRNGAGQPLLGHIVTVAHQGLTTVAPALNTTGTDGVTTFTLTSTADTSGVVRATVNPGPHQVTPADAPTVTFASYHTLGGRLVNLTSPGLVLTTEGAPISPSQLTRRRSPSLSPSRRAPPIPFG